MAPLGQGAGPSRFGARVPPGSGLGSLPVRARQVQGPGPSGLGCGCFRVRIPTGSGCGCFRVQVPLGSGCGSLPVRGAGPSRFGTRLGCRCSGAGADLSCFGIQSVREAAGSECGSSRNLQRRLGMRIPRFGMRIPARFGMQVTRLRMRIPRFRMRIPARFRTPPVPPRARGAAGAADPTAAGEARAGLLWAAPERAGRAGLRTALSPPPVPCPLPRYPLCPPPVRELRRPRCRRCRSRAPSGSGSSAFPGTPDPEFLSFPLPISSPTYFPPKSPRALLGADSKIRSR